MKTWDPLVSRDNLLAELLTRRLSNYFLVPPFASSYSSIPPTAISNTLRQTELGDVESPNIKDPREGHRGLPLACRE